jgi:primosomal protein N' (replication factor Y)
VLVQAESLEQTLGWASRLGRWITDRGFSGVRVLGPAPAPRSRLKRIYRYHLVLKSDRRDTLGAALRELLAWLDREEIPRRAVVVDVDPMHLM